MSETEITASLLPQNVFVADAGGALRVSPVVDTLTIDRLAGGGRRLKVTVQDKPVVDFWLDAATASHIARLLLDPTSEAAE